VLTAFTAKRLPYADHVVCLGSKGEIVEQGTFAELNDAGGYVASFSLRKADWNPLSDREEVKPHSDTKKEIKPPVLPKELAAEISVDFVEHAGSSESENASSDSENALSDSEKASTKRAESTHEDQLVRVDQDDTSRRTGDIQIYLYYVKSVGWWATIIFAIAIIGFVFCVSFPSKRHRP
jgi:hypothetical protein